MAAANFSSISGGYNNSISAGPDSSLNSISGGRNRSESTLYGWRAGSEQGAMGAIVPYNLVSD